VEPRIVIKQVNGMVTMVKTADSNDLDNEVSHIGAIQDDSTPWNVEEGGPGHARKKAKAVAKGGLPGATIHENGGSKAGGHG
jgi:hypothetical protein